MGDGLGVEVHVGGHGPGSSIGCGETRTKVLRKGQVVTICPSRTETGQGVRRALVGQGPATQPPSSMRKSQNFTKAGQASLHPKIP